MQRVKVKFNPYYDVYQVHIWVEETEQKPRDGFLGKLGLKKTVTTEGWKIVKDYDNNWSTKYPRKWDNYAEAKQFAEKCLIDVELTAEYNHQDEVDEIEKV